jgi:hypothetical protein
MVTKRMLMMEQTIRQIQTDDTDGVDNTEGPDIKSGETSPYETRAYYYTSCMEDDWKYAGNTKSLVCRADEVCLNPVSSSVTTSCKEGEPFTIDLSGSIHMNRNCIIVAKVDQITIR